MNARNLREKAQQCRNLADVTENRAVEEQLRQWAEEYDEEADAIDDHRCRAEPEC